MSTHKYTMFNIKKKIILNFPKSTPFFPKCPKNEFETAVVNEPSVFEPLKFYCIGIPSTLLQQRSEKLPVTTSNNFVEKIMCLVPKTRKM